MTPGHEPVVRVVKVGEKVTHLQGRRPSAGPADWKHLRTAKSNGAFGYNFDGAFEGVRRRRALCRVPDGEEVLIRVGGPVGRAVGLIEPWATVEGSLRVGRAQPRRRRWPAGRRRMISTSTAEHKPAEVVRCRRFEGVQGEFDDVVFFGADADAIEKAPWIGTRGTMCVVLGGEKIRASPRHRPRP